MAYDAQFAVPVTIFRLSEPYTEEWIFDEPLARSYPLQIASWAASGETIPVPTSVGKDWVHAKDVARAFLLAAGNESAQGEVFHIGGDAYLTWREFAEQVVNALGSSSPVEEKSLGDWPGDAHELNNLRLNIDKARTILRFEPEYPKSAFLKLIQAEASRWAEEATT